MFCTPKEQETCDVEKRGCEGCYYSYEENIINRVKRRINELKLDYAIDNLDLVAIEGLLNLYNQEKEKINDLQGRIIDAVNYINDNCIDTNVDGTKKEIANIEDLEELKNILGGKYLYE